jgi:hypothetical protein
MISSELLKMTKETYCDDNKGLKTVTDEPFLWARSQRMAFFFRERRVGMPRGLIFSYGFGTIRSRRNWIWQICFMYLNHVMCESVKWFKQSSSWTMHERSVRGVISWLYSLFSSLCAPEWNVRASLYTLPSYSESVHKLQYCSQVS